MDLIVVESPTKAKTLSRFLGGDYRVEASMGHIKDLPKEKLSVDVEHNFEPDYVSVAKKEKVINAIKKASKGVGIVYLATDPDREGEAIAKHIAELFDGKGSPELKRIVFHEITKTAVEEAVENPRQIDENLVNAQVARRVLDRLVGYKLSPLLWKKVRRGLSAGRVQTVAVRLIVEKEREIEAFKPEEFWEIYVEVSAGAGQNFTVKLLKINGKPAKVEDSEGADKIVSGLDNSDYSVSDVRKKEVVKSPYPPFTTSTLTQAGSRVFGWSAKRTMQVAQKLYEEGLITYHRTDSTFLSSQAIEAVRKLIGEKYGSEYLPATPRHFKTKSKLAQEAHEAIRPTDASRAAVDLGGPEAKLYDIIWKRFVSCQMSASVYDETVIDVLAKYRDGDRESYLLRAGGQVMRFDGWRKVVPLTRDEFPMLPEVNTGDILQKQKVTSLQKFTQPPSRYTEASLIKTLEKLGIGRPSTYAPTISTIQTRNYVEKSEGKFYPTPIGVAVTDFLVSNFDKIFDYSFTALMEEELDEIAKGGLEWHKMMGDFYGPFDTKLGKVTEKSERVKIETEKLGKKCPDCKDGDLVIRIGRFGKFISCSRFPECKHTEKYIEKIEMKCPDCGQGDVIIKSTRHGKKFFGCSRYPECKWASWKKPSN